VAAQSRQASPYEQLDDDKAMARARFEADQATFTELAQKRVEAARMEQTDLLALCLRRPEWHPLDRAIPGLLRVQQAEQVLKGDVRPGPLLEMSWRYAWLAEAVASAANDGSPHKVEAYFRARTHRFELEMARLGQKNVGNEGGLFDDFLLADDPLTYAKQVAQRSFEAEQAKPADLARERIRSASERLQNFQDHPFRIRSIRPYYILQEAEYELARARLAPQGDTSVALLQQSWVINWQTELITEIRYRGGTAAFDQLIEKRGDRLKDQYELVRRGEFKTVSSEAVVTDFFLWDFELLDVLRALASARLEAEQTSVEEVARMRVQGIYEAFEDLAHPYLGGRSSAAPLDRQEIIDFERTMYEAELAVGGEQGRAAALEASWRRIWAEDRRTQAKYEGGTAALEHFGLMRGRRLEIEMELARLRDKRPK
jgi:hypothetical protein